MMGDKPKPDADDPFDVKGTEERSAAHFDKLMKGEAYRIPDKKKPDQPKSRRPSDAVG